MLHRSCVLLYLTLFLLFISSNALKNISFDDTDEAFITYSSNGYWKGAKVGMGLGSHMFSREWDAYALFNFTGVAVYYWAPLYNNDTIIDFSLDGGPSSSITLRDPSAAEGSWVPTQSSKVMASFKSLTYGNHTLRISCDRYRSNGVVVDYFDVTTLDSDGSPTNSPGGSSNSPSSASQIPSSRSSQATNNNNSTTQGYNDADWKTKYRELDRSFKIAVGVISTVLGLLVCCAIFVSVRWIRPLVERGKKKEEALVDSVSSPQDVEKVLALPADNAASQTGKDVKSIASDSDGTEAVVSAVDGSKGKKTDEIEA